MRRSPDTPHSRGDGPERTCIGCRRRAPAATLVRVVAEAGATPPVVVPDPRHRAPGRGAWLHRDPDCLDTATRRRAFGRALRLRSAPETAAVATWIAENPVAAAAPADTMRQPSPRSGRMDRSEWTTSGRPAE